MPPPLLLWLRSPWLLEISQVLLLFGNNPPWNPILPVLNYNGGQFVSEHRTFGRKTLFTLCLHSCYQWHLSIEGNILKLATQLSIFNCWLNNLNHRPLNNWNQTDCSTVSEQIITLAVWWKARWSINILEANYCCFTENLLDWKQKYSSRKTAWVRV